MSRRPRLGGVSERLTRDSEGTVWRLAGVAGAGGAAQARARVAEEGRERTAGLRAMRARGHSDGRGGSAAWGRTRGGAAARQSSGNVFPTQKTDFSFLACPIDFPKSSIRDEKGIELDRIIGWGKYK